MLWNGNKCGKNYGNEILKGNVLITHYDISETTGDCEIY
jgi:hypothetical protein